MNLKYTIGVVLLFLITNVYSQPFEIGHTTIDFVDTTRGNRVVATEIYYPASSIGDNVPLVTNSQLFPVLAFGHGFVMTWDAYQNIWSTIVPNGYIMAFPKTEGSISPSHLEFGKDLAFVIQQMTLLGSNSTSIFYNRISATTAVMGHSMGGGASFLAASINTNITALINFAAAETTPSAVQAANSITIPTLMFAGTNDCVTPPATNQVLMYNSLNSSCKTLVTLVGGSHCQMANNNFFCTIGESSCTPTPAISRAQQHSLLNTFLVPWLDYQLKNNCTQGALFDTLLTSQSGITSQKNCIQCNPLNTSQETNASITVYPNPSSGLIVLEGKQGSVYQFLLFDIQSKKLLDKSIINQEVIDLSSFSKGVYFYQLLENNVVIKKDKIILK